MNQYGKCDFDNNHCTGNCPSQCCERGPAGPKGDYGCEGPQVLLVLREFRVLRDLSESRDRKDARKIPVQPSPPELPELPSQLFIRYLQIIKLGLYGVFTITVLFNMLHYPKQFVLKQKLDSNFFISMYIDYIHKRNQRRAAKFLDILIVPKLYE